MDVLLTLPDCKLRIALIILDVGAGLLIIYLMQALTRHACFFGHKDEVWAMVRRLVFAMTAFALFTRGVWRFNDAHPVSKIEFVTQSIIIVGLVLFAILRALDVIDQDHLKGWKAKN